MPCLVKNSSLLYEFIWEALVKEGIANDLYWEAECSGCSALSHGPTLGFPFNLDLFPVRI